MIRRRQQGYTLIEILGAFFIMTIIMTMVTGIFVENGRQRAASLGLMQEALSSAAALDLIAGDLEAAIFLKAADGTRPDEHPWRFVAEGRGDHGAVSLRFVTQNAPIANRPEHGSRWVEAAYFLEESDDRSFVLWRWLSARPPTEIDARLPDPGDPGTMRVAVGVDAFGFRFLDGEGNWIDEWDSAYASPATPMPRAVEISIALLREARVGEEIEEDASGVAGAVRTRRVAIAMPPLDVAELIGLGADTDASGDADCFTISQCLALDDSSWYEELLDADCNGDEELCAMLSDSEGTCWSSLESAYPAIAAKAPGDCQG